MFASSETVTGEPSRGQNGFKLRQTNVFCAVTDRSYQACKHDKTSNIKLGCNTQIVLVIPELLKSCGFLSSVAHYTQTSAKHLSWSELLQYFEVGNLAIV